jgi:hypothetical protein
LGLVAQDRVAELIRQGAGKRLQGLWHIGRSRRIRNGATQGAAVYLARSEEIVVIGGSGSPSEPTAASSAVKPLREPFTSDSAAESLDVSHIHPTGGPEATGDGWERPEVETPATVGFRPVHPGQRIPQKWGGERS